ncbi:hypothetical protein Pmani_001611 [Petrolisthes manimaculis]|uniref:Uncharacterized protein n=1 Tax=Petrolisthes manimaculis TaxID=1843537 RepID=A0AAE1URE0_9EUCA|nr:hypothetical protein Pmani_001611 [Petrolisthes manimaculis]
MSTSESLKQGSRSRHKRSWWRHLLLLLWKSLLLRRKHWLITLLEILLPTALFSVILFLRLLPNSALVPKHRDQTIFKPVDELTQKIFVCNNYALWDNQTESCRSNLRRTTLKVFYGPPGQFTERVMSDINAALHFKDEDTILVDSLEQMDNIITQSYYAVNTTNTLPPYYIGLFFDTLDDPHRVPWNLTYNLGISGSWQTGAVYPFTQIAGPNTNNTAKYYEQGFTLIQSLVDRSYISQLTGNTSFLDDYEVSQTNQEAEGGHNVVSYD